MTSPESRQISENLAIPVSEKPTKSIPIWRFAVPLLIQTVMILAIPAQAVYTHMTGRTVILQTVPVDPYDLLRGYSQTLSYEISQQDRLKKLPGWKELIEKSPGTDKTYNPVANGTKVYVILQSEKTNGSGMPKAWKPIRISGEKPKSLAANEVAIKGRFEQGSIRYNLETYYMPEDQRNDINNDISQVQRATPRQQQPFVVEVKVDSQGNAVPVSMWVRDRKYQF